MGATIAFAPLLGGLIASTLGWRWIFCINLPLVVLLALMVLRSIEESRDSAAARLDPMGSLTFAGSLGCLIWAMIDANQVGWTSVDTVGRLLVSAFLFGLFIMIESSQARPMIDLKLMRSPRFIGALLGMFAYAACAQVMMTLLPLYLQSGLQLSGACPDQLIASPASEGSTYFKNNFERHSAEDGGNERGEVEGVSLRKDAAGRHLDRSLYLLSRTARRSFYGFTNDLVFDFLFNYTKSYGQLLG